MPGSQHEQYYTAPSLGLLWEVVKYLKFKLNNMVLMRSWGLQIKSITKRLKVQSAFSVCNKSDHSNFPLSPSARLPEKKCLKGTGQKKIFFLSSFDLTLMQGKCYPLLYRMNTMLCRYWLSFWLDQESNISLLTVVFIRKFTFALNLFLVLLCTCLFS